MHTVSEEPNILPNCTKFKVQ